MGFRFGFGLAFSKPRTATWIGSGWGRVGFGLGVGVRLGLESCWDRDVDRGHADGRAQLGQLARRGREARERAAPGWG